MFSTIQAAISDLKAHKMVIVVDDENRENEGDFIIPAAAITPKDVNFMATHGRGLICAPIAASLAKKYALELMIDRPEDSMQTAFTISVDAAHGTSTGISVQDRATTLRLLADPNTCADDFVKPGHIFPLIAKSGGVLSRPGHTEAAIDLCSLAGFSPAGVICEILDEDGSSARLPYLSRLAQRFDLKIITIEDLIIYRNTKLEIHHQESASHVNY